MYVLIEIEWWVEISVKETLPERNLNFWEAKLLCKIVLTLDYVHVAVSIQEHFLNLGFSGLLDSNTEIPGLILRLRFIQFPNKIGGSVKYTVIIYYIWLSQSRWPNHKQYQTAIGLSVLIFWKYL